MTVGRSSGAIAYGVLFNTVAESPLYLSSHEMLNNGEFKMEAGFYAIKR